MENNKYLDKIFSSLIRCTRFDTVKREMLSPFHHEGDLIPSFYLFEIYCKDQFGLTHYETVNMWYDYMDFIRKKIGYGE